MTNDKATGAQLYLDSQVENERLKCDLAACSALLKQVNQKLDTLSAQNAELARDNELLRTAQNAAGEGARHAYCFGLIKAHRLKVETHTPHLDKPKWCVISPSIGRWESGYDLESLIEQSILRERDCG